MCVPEDLDLALDLKVQDGAAPLDPRHGAAIQSVIQSAPRPAGIEARAQFADGQLTLTATGGPLAGAAPTWAYFFPFEGGVIDHAAVQTGQRGPDGLTLSVAAGRGLSAEGPDGTDRRRPSPPTSALGKSPPSLARFCRARPAPAP